MREIKFRAWDKEELKMNYSGIIGCGSSSEVINIGFDGLINLQNAFGLDYGNRNPVFDKPETKFILMQYTGLKENVFEDVSKNKEIYEGDIVEFINGKRLVVEWNDDTCQFQYSDGSPINSGERYATHKAIVGNIYENLELL